MTASAPLFIRRVADDGPHTNHLAVFDEFGRIIGNQSKTIVSEVGALATIEITLAIIDGFGGDVQWGDPDPIPQDLGAAMRAFSTLSPDNQRRFATAMAHLLNPKPPPIAPANGAVFLSATGEVIGRVQLNAANFKVQSSFTSEDQVREIF